jgi:capsular exopolysaccharide synthesis family protein
VGRIDDALRRAREGDAVATVDAAMERDFVSPWSISDDTDPAADSKPVDSSQSPDDLLDEESSHSLSRLDLACGERLVRDPRCDRGMVEQFRRLAGTLHSAQGTNGTRTVMIASASPGDGKTLTALNLAFTLGQSYKRRVLLVDGDLRKPSLSEMAGASRTAGLSAALKARTDQKLPLIPLVEGLWLLPAGPPDPDPLSGLSSTRLRRILDEAGRRFDWVLLDSSPMGLVADGGLLAELADCVLMVIRTGETQHGIVTRTVERLGRERIIGVVMNGLSTASNRNAYYYSYPPTDSKDPRTGRSRPRPYRSSG